MILAVDIGNTNIVIGVLQGDQITLHTRIRTDRQKTWQEYLYLLEAFLSHHCLAPQILCGGIVSSVVPNLRPIFRQAIETLIDRPCLIVGPGLKTGLNIQMENAAALGSDLVVDAVAALTNYKPPLAIFDLGTATTLSILDPQGRYIGGTICPGLNLGLTALAEGTSSLPHIDLTTPGSIVGKNTLHCMQAGAIYGHAALLDGLLERAEEELGYALQAVATGGLIDLVLPYCKRMIHSDRDLTLRGLAYIFAKNAQSLGEPKAGGATHG